MPSSRSTQWLPHQCPWNPVPTDSGPGPPFTPRQQRPQSPMAWHSLGGLVMAVRPLWRSPWLGWSLIYTIFWFRRSSHHRCDSKVSCSGFKPCPCTAYVAFAIPEKMALGFLGVGPSNFPTYVGILVSVQMTLTKPRSHPTKALCEEPGMFIERLWGPHLPFQQWKDCCSKCRFRPALRQRKVSERKY